MNEGSFLDQQEFSSISRNLGRGHFVEICHWMHNQPPFCNIRPLSCFEWMIWAEVDVACTWLGFDVFDVRVAKKPYVWSGFSRSKTSHRTFAWRSSSNAWIYALRQHMNHQPHQRWRKSRVRTYLDILLAPEVSPISSRRFACMLRSRVADTVAWLPYCFPILWPWWVSSNKRKMRMNPSSNFCLQFRCAENSQFARELNSHNDRFCWWCRELSTVLFCDLINFSVCHQERECERKTKGYYSAHVHANK